MSRPCRSHLLLQRHSQCAVSDSTRLWQMKGRWMRLSYRNRTSSARMLAALGEVTIIAETHLGRPKLVDGKAILCSSSGREATDAHFIGPLHCPTSTSDPISSRYVRLCDTETAISTQDYGPRRHAIRVLKLGIWQYSSHVDPHGPNEPQFTSISHGIKAAKLLMTTTIPGPKYLLAELVWTLSP